MKKRHRKRRRQKQILMMITVVLTIILLVVIGVSAYLVINKLRDKRESVAIEEVTESSRLSSEEAVEKADESQQTSSKADEKEESSHQESAEEGKTSEAENTYENLIAGTGKLNFSYYMDNIYVNSEFKDYQDELFSHLKSREYTISALISEFNDIFMHSGDFISEGKVTYAGYSYLDCGNDGSKELALQFVCPVVEESSSLTLILKDMGGDIQVVYAFCCWSRSETNINEYGVLTGGGSGGASLHGWDLGIIDANGKYTFGYSEEEQFDINMFYTGQDHPEIDTSSYDGSIYAYSLRTKEAAGEDAWPQYYSYAVFDDNGNEMNIPNLYTDSEYKKVMDVFGLNFIPKAEFDKKAEDRANEIGATSQMRSGANLEYKELKF